MRNMKKWFAKRKEWFLIWVKVFACFVGLGIIFGLITLLSILTDDPAAANNISALCEFSKILGGVGILCLLGMSVAI